MCLGPRLDTSPVSATTFLVNEMKIERMGNSGMGTMKRILIWKEIEWKENGENERRI